MVVNNVRFQIFWRCSIFSADVLVAMILLQCYFFNGPLNIIFHFDIVVVEVCHLIQRWIHGDQQYSFLLHSCCCLVLLHGGCDGCSLWYLYQSHWFYPKLSIFKRLVTIASGKCFGGSTCLHCKHDFCLKTNKQTKTIHRASLRYTSNVSSSLLYLPVDKLCLVWTKNVNEVYKDTWTEQFVFFVCAFSCLFFYLRILIIEVLYYDLST